MPTTRFAKVIRKTWLILVFLTFPGHNLSFAGEIGQVQQVQSISRDSPLPPISYLRKAFTKFKAEVFIHMNQFCLVHPLIRLKGVFSGPLAGCFMTAVSMTSTSSPGSLASSPQRCSSPTHNCLLAHYLSHFHCQRFRSGSMLAQCSPRLQLLEMLTMLWSTSGHVPFLNFHSSTVQKREKE